MEGDRCGMEGGRGLTCVVVLCKVDGYLSANAPRGSYYQGHLLFKRHCSCTWGREGSRICDRAQCIMNDAGIAVSIAVIMRLRTAAAGGIDVDGLLSLYALVS